MKNIISIRKIVVSLALVLIAASASFAEHEVALPAVGGYDVVSYFGETEAVKGSGFHTVEFENQSYLFSSKENKEKFEKNPEKYLPQFGGWCAYGVSVGKKFYVDPTVFEIVDGKLYLNLDSEIQKKWAGEKEKNIQAAHKSWESIKNKSAGKL